MTEWKGTPEQIPKKGDYFIIKGKEGRVLSIPRPGHIEVKIQGKISEILNGDLWKQIDKRKKYYTKKRKTKAVKNISKDLKKETAENILKVKKEIQTEEKKEEKKEDKNKGGRPTKITQSTLDKLKLCFMVGLTDEEACYYAKISTDLLYKFQRENEEFIKEKNILKKAINIQAKINIGNAIKKHHSIQDSWKWLEKKEPTEFGNKVGLEHSGKVETGMTEEDKKMYDKILANNLK